MNTRRSFSTDLNEARMVQTVITAFEQVDIRAHHCSGVQLVCDVAESIGEEVKSIGFVGMLAMAALTGFDLTAGPVNGGVKLDDPNGDLMLIILVNAMSIKAGSNTAYTSNEALLRAYGGKNREVLAFAHGSIKCPACHHEFLGPINELTTSAIELTTVTCPDCSIQFGAHAHKDNPNYITSKFTPA